VLDEVVQLVFWRRAEQLETRAGGATQESTGDERNRKWPMSLKYGRYSFELSAASDQRATRSTAALPAW
jgi:hypothetical protein